VSGEGGFLSRWARRKEQAKTGIDPDAPPPAIVEPVAPADPAIDAEELARKVAALPNIADIGPGTDIKVFLESWVPAALRQQALKHVWMTDPKISTFIETADYQWDFTVPGGAPGCGPLEPDFDASAFLKRLFNEHDPAPLQDCDTSSRSAPSTENKISPAPHNSSERDDVVAQMGQGESALRSQVESSEGLKVNHVALQHEKSVNDVPDVASSDLPPIARRRHGGALPT
jgi:hypothetical protein